MSNGVVEKWVRQMRLGYVRVVAAVDAMGPDGERKRMERVEDAIRALDHQIGVLQQVIEQIAFASGFTEKVQDYGYDDTSIENEIVAALRRDKRQ